MTPAFDRPELLWLECLREEVLSVVIRDNAVSRTMDEQQWGWCDVVYRSARTVLVADYKEGQGPFQHPKERDVRDLVTHNATI